MAKNDSKKYAVLVGCNYPNTQNELHGCVNDVMRMQGSLIHRFGFAKENINILIDTDKLYTKPTATVHTAAPAAGDRNGDQAEANGDPTRGP